MMSATATVLPRVSVQLMPVRVSLPVLLIVAVKTIGMSGDGALAQVSATVMAGARVKKPKSMELSIVASEERNTIEGLGLLSFSGSLPAPVVVGVIPAGETTSTL